MDFGVTGHVIMPGGHPGDEFLMKAADELEHRFGIGHTTIQIETSEDMKCRLAPDEVV